MFPPYYRRLLEAKKLQSLSEDIDVDSDVSADTTTSSRPNSRQAKISTLSIDSTLSRSGSIGSTASPIVRTMGSSSTSRARSKAVKSSRTAIVASSSTSVSPIHNQAAAALLQLSVSTTNSNTINHTNNATTTTSTSRNTMTTANTDEHDNTYTTSNTDNTTNTTTSTSNIPEEAQIPTFDALLGSSRRQGGEGVFFPDPCPDDLTAMRLPSDSSFNFTYDPSTSFDQLNLDDSNTPPLPAPDPVSGYPDRYVPDTVIYESNTINLLSVAHQPLNIEDSSNTTNMYTTRNSVVGGSSTIDKDNTEDGMSPLLPTLEAFLFGPDSTTNSPILPITSRKSITASSVTAHIEAMTIAEKGLTTTTIEGSEMDTTDSIAL